ncbi:MAG: silent information regulator protein Sir2 [Bacteroidales bacterium]|nr:silent information regulator protein Sir2 [Bacteroidales bacterium]
MKFKSLFAAGALLLAVAAGAQDPNERFYNYELLNPQGNTRNISPKPKVKGWAQERVKEPLDRGVVAVKTQEGVYVGWRLLETDDPGVAFNVYRSVNGRSFRKVNGRPISATTDFLDKKAPAGSSYQLRPVLGGKETGRSKTVSALSQNYVSIPFQGNYPSQKVGVGDLNGDGTYDFVIKQPQQRTDPGAWHRSEDTFKLEAYLADGTFLWRHDLGWNIEQGVWYSPYVVADLDGDGKAEIAVKTAPTDKDYRDEAGRVVGRVPANYNGKPGSSPYGPCPEYLSILDGMTGKEIDRVPWIEQGQEFGDYNRNNRNQMAIAYLDGKTPAVIINRGTYRKMTANAYQLVNGKLELLWAWNGDEESPVIRAQGSHQIVCADIDNDGREEVILGAVVVDDNGQALWSAGVGHPDKSIVADIDPDNPGLEILFGVEVWHEKRGVCLVDAATGKELWNIGEYTGHVGNAMATDLDPSIPGLECFATEDAKGHKTGETKYIMDCKGNRIGTMADVPGCTDWIWWDADNLREMPVYGDQRGSFGLGKYKGPTVQEGIEGSILLIGDLFGDWREEIVTVKNGELRVYTTTIPARDRRVTLVQDPLYRSYIFNRSMGYTQSPSPSYTF